MATARHRGHHQPPRLPVEREPTTLRRLGRLCLAGTILDVCKEIPSPGFLLRSPCGRRLHTA